MNLTLKVIEIITNNMLNILNFQYVNYESAPNEFTYLVREGERERERERERFTSPEFIAIKITSDSDHKDLIKTRKINKNLFM